MEQVVCLASLLLTLCLAACGSGGSDGGGQNQTGDGDPISDPGDDGINFDENDDLIDIGGENNEPESPNQISSLNTHLLSNTNNLVHIGSILAVPTALTLEDLQNVSVYLTNTGTDSIVRTKFSFDSTTGQLLVDPEYDLTPNLGYRLEVSTPTNTAIYDLNTRPVEWHAAGYILYAVDQVISSDHPALNSSGSEFLEGVALRFSWPSFENDSGEYDFSPLANSLDVIRAVNKKASVSIFPASKSLNEPLLARPERVFYSANANPNGGTLGDCSRIADPFDENYRSRYYRMLHALGRHLNENPELNDAISYVIGAGDMTTRNWAYGLAFQDLFSDATCTTPITWAEAGFNAESMLAIVKEGIAVFMEAFPDKVLWLSVGDLKFDGTELSCGKSSCVATLAADWALEHYPNRVGIWREDLNAKQNPPREGSLWETISSYRPRLGAQMVFNVQGCPGDATRNCRVADNGTPPDVALSSALTIGVSNNTAQNYGRYLMNYVEIYAADVQDESLSSVFSEMAENNEWRSDITPPTTPLGLSNLSNEAGRVELTWLPVLDRWDKENSSTDALNPFPSKAATLSIVYKVWKDGALIANTNVNNFTDSAAVNGTFNYQISAVDALGNESQRSSILAVNVP
ncbi:hypothetical protein NBRC116494_15540 [Aurantivibrio plasticivorans]